MRYLIGSIVAAAAVLLSGCSVNMESAGPVQTYPSAIELDKAEIVNTKFTMGVGEMIVQGGSEKLMEGVFTYAIPSWKPEIKYTSTGFRGTLTIDQPSKSKGLNTNSSDYKWEVKLNDKVAQDLEFINGVGKTRLDLSTINIRSLAVKMGVGDLEMNLRGKPSKDYTVSIKGGVGNAEIKLPKDIGVVAQASGGLGGVDTVGMSKDGNQYVNEAYKKSPVTIRLTIEGGVGSLKLMSE